MNEQTFLLHLVLLLLLGFCARFLSFQEQRAILAAVLLGSELLLQIAGCKQEACGGVNLLPFAHCRV